MMWLCSNCKSPSKESEDGRCPACGLRMEQLDAPRLEKVIEFGLMLTTLLHGGRKPQ